jgi:hypothetical protein
MTITGTLRETVWQEGPQSGQYAITAPTATWNLEVPEQLMLQMQTLVGSQMIATGTQISVRSYGGIFRVDGIEGV